MLLFSAQGENSDSVRMLTGVHLLTVQSLLMFVMALCYDIQVNDGNATLTLVLSLLIIVMCALVVSTRHWSVRCPLRRI
jgi:hypothetical protein